MNQPLTMSESFAFSDEIAGPPTFKLGDRVRFTKPLKRKYQQGSPRTYYSDWLKVWEPEPVWRGEEPVYEGIVVGLRTLANGKNKYHGDEGIEFLATEYFPAVLIAYDLRRKPRYVRPENVELIGEKK